MSFARLSNQLQRDLKKNPKKAAMLALLAVVAAWFWAPLVFKSGDAQVSASPSPPTASNPTMPAMSAPTATPAAPQIPWQDLVAWIEADAQMQTSEIENAAASRSSPFAPGAAKVARLIAAKQEREQKEKAQKVDEAAKAAPAIKVELDPRKLGIVVSSVMVGRVKRSARINGETFSLGEDLKIAGVTFQLIDVQPGGVVLDHDGERFEIPIQRGLARSDAPATTP